MHSASKNRNTPECAGACGQPPGGARTGLKWLCAVTGLAALVWFLLRVIPKPSRAAYPCQRAAAPLASGFNL